MDSSTNNHPVMLKRAPLISRSDGLPVATKVVECPVPVPSRDAIATMVEYVLLVIVSSIVVAAIFSTLGQGVTVLVKRVGQLLVS
jgi:Flp pilus assembly pilin Flp